MKTKAKSKIRFEKFQGKAKFKKGETVIVIRTGRRAKIVNIRGNMFNETIPVYETAKVAYDEEQLRKIKKGKKKK